MRFIERSPDHHYTFDGVTYPGTTGILKVLDKSSALMSWASRMTAEAAVKMGGALVPLIESVGPQGAVKALTARSGWELDKASSTGTQIHDWADKLVRGESFGPYPPDVEKRVIAYGEWWAASGWKLRTSEAMLVNTAWRYGGTLDLLCYDADGRTVLADIKSGNIDYRGKLYDTILLQLAAYGAAEWMDTGDDNLYTMPAVDRYAIVHVTEAGIRVVEANVGEAERRAFKACIDLSTWRDSVKARAL